MFIDHFHERQHQYSTWVHNGHTYYVFNGMNVKTRNSYYSRTVATLGGAQRCDCGAIHNVWSINWH
jgi:hypothetical protein